MTILKSACLALVTSLSILLSLPLLAGDTHYGNYGKTVNPPLTSIVARADDNPDSLQSHSTSDPASNEMNASSWKTRFWGRPFRNHLYLGMWSYHFQPRDGQDWNNQLIAVSYHGYYAGTFYNTFSDRSWSLGVQRQWFQNNYGPLDVEVGYRAGLLNGYKNHMNLYDTHLFPLFQVVADIDYKGLGVEFSWAGVVLTAGFFYRF